MDDENKSQTFVKWGAGILGVSGILAVVAVPGRVGIIIMLGILLFGLLLFGGFFLWQRRRARRNREQFTSEIEVQASAAPRSISDPKKRADLDKVREKFQTGLQEFKSRGKDIYKLPWYVIIGESGSGKTEAIRHSEVDFPPGLNKEHQGSGGTVNMDWWFTNRGIILDTAGSMLFPEAGSQDNNQQWQEFLRLLRKARPQCPINGLFLVLSIESLIRDSADKISQKASRLAQQLDIIQRTLDVRFPVYLLVTKADLLTGFREFFDSIEDPLLQHQMFGWSNPDPLDAPFRPDMVEQHLNSVAERIRRRRMALLRESSAAGRIGDTQHFFASSYQLGRGPAQTRRLDEVDSMFAFPESIMRLAPRLRRYLETVFVAGEWSAKPVFLRGIYFTSSMREGKALDEAIAFATGLSLDQLPEDRTWEKNRAFFLRDLFHDKVFRESGLVTRATNTLKMLRQRQLAIFGSAGIALVLLLVFAGFATHRLKKSILAERAVWETAAANWTAGEWSNAIVKAGSPNPLHFQFSGSNLVEVGSAKPSLLEFHSQLHAMVERPLAVGWIFAPLKWMNAGNVRARPIGQRLVFEGSVLRPLVRATRDKMSDPSAFPGDEAALARHSLAWRYLTQLEAEDQLGNTTLDSVNAEKYLHAFISYLTDEDWKPNTNLVNVMAATYSQPALSKNDGRWPPEKTSGGSTLSANTAIKAGLEKFQKASLAAQTNIDRQLGLVNDLADKLLSYNQNEQTWLNNSAGDCASLERTLTPLATSVHAAWAKVHAITNQDSGPLTSLLARYRSLEGSASNASALSLSQPLQTIIVRLPEAKKTSGLFRELSSYLNELGSRAGETVRTSYVARPWISSLDSNSVAPFNTNSGAPFFARWSLLSNACAIASTPVSATPDVIGDGWKHYGDLKSLVDTFRTNLLAYNGPLAPQVVASCNRLASDAEGKLKNDFVESYVKLATDTLSKWSTQTRWTLADVTAARVFFANLERDLGRCEAIGSQSNKLDRIRSPLADSKQAVLTSIDRDLNSNVGFPVGLGSSQEKKLAELVGLRKFVDGLSSELTNAVWQSASAPLATLQKSCDLYGPIINMLVTDSGSGAEWQLFFVGQTQTTENMAASIFRYLKVTFDDGKQTVNPDLSSVAANATAPLGKGNTERGITLLFQRKEADPSAPPPIKYDDWWLPRLVKSCEDQPTLVSGAWRFKLKVEDPAKPKDQGYVFFEARPSNANQPLPKAWPK
jgi:hypothetical protein